MDSTKGDAIPGELGISAVDSAGDSDFSADADLAAFYYLIVTCSRATSVHDEDGGLVLFNPSCTSLLGYERGELSIMETPNIVHPADAALLTARAEDAKTSASGRAGTRLRLVRKNGDEVLVDLDMSVARVGHRRFLVIVSTPVTTESMAERPATWAHAFG